MDSIWQDVRFAFRSLRTGPGLIAVAVLSLALGIGANTTAFSVVDVFMLRPLPYPDAHELVSVYSTNQERGWTSLELSAPDFRDLRDRGRTLDLAAQDGATYNFSEGDEPERIQGKRVSWNFFRVLEVQPALGRAFLPEEETVGQGNVVILSDGLWHRRFGADPSVMGRSVTLDSEAHTVVGVMPPGFWFEEPGNDLWTPLSFSGEQARNSHYLETVGRLLSGSTLEQARAEVAQIAEALADAFPETSAGNGARVLTLHEEFFDEGFKAGSLIATVAVAFVLLIACANVANLIMTRAAGREREVALRRALGAGRLRIVRQFMTEAVIVAIMGGGLGVLFAVAGIRGMISIMPAEFPRVDEIGLDGRVLLFTAILSLATGIIFGLAPALQTSRANLIAPLKEGGRTGTGTKSGRLRKALVAAEVSLALVLLVSSTLLVQGFLRIRTTDRGFTLQNVLTFRFTLPEKAYPEDEQVVAFQDRLMSLVRAVPGVVSVGATSILPMWGGSGTWYSIPGEDRPDEAGRLVTSYRVLLPGFFETMQIPLVAGRVMENEDRSDGRAIIVINEAMAERHWADTDPIRQQIEFSSGRREIVGVVKNTLELGVETGVQPMIYFSALQSTRRSLAWVVRTTAAPEMIAGAVQRGVAALDPNVPVYRVMTMEEHLKDVTGGDTVMAKMMAAMAVIALLLAVGGVYGVMAYSVTQRTQEMGIRMALGAQRKNVLSLVVRQGMVLALIGVVVGTGIALGVTRGLSRFLFGVSPFDPAAFGVVAVTLLVAGIVATYVPARRATRVDPVTALRVE
jgi:putative ABC transport system permease protein